MSRLLQRFGDQVRRHVQPCLAVYQWLEEEKPTRGRRRMYPQSMCGFLMTAGRQPWMVTSGHAIAGLRERAEQGRMIYHGVVVAGMRDTGERAELRIDYRSPQKIAWFDDDFGVDCGAIQLTQRERTILERGGAQFLACKHMASLRDAATNAHEAYFAVGFPTAVRGFRQSLTRRSVTVSYAPTIVPLVPLAEEPAAYRREAARWFARIGQAEYVRSGAAGRPFHLHDMEGLSGSPVFGVTGRPGYIDFRLLGIQTAYLPRNRVVIANYVLPWWQHLSQRSRK